MILRARVVLPISQPPIENGGLVVSGDRIAAVGRWTELRPHWAGPVLDLGDCILLPGLINAHCHLDYTAMAGLLPPLRSFSDWIKSIVALKASWSDSEFFASWMKGAQMLLRSGTTTVVDIEAVPALMPGILEQTPLNVLSCHELISIKSNPRELLAQAVTRVEAWPNPQKGLSPHATYTTSTDLLAAAADEARSRGWLLTTHVAESKEEFDMFSAARGPMYDWLAAQRDNRDCGRCTPVQHVAEAGALNRMIVVHANYITEEDVRLLADARATVVHCPRSHDYFAHQPFPCADLQAARVNVCLGTDSLATVRRNARDGLELSLFAEMRTFARNFPAVAPETILRFASMNPARAIQCEGDRGELRAGARADLITVPIGDCRDPFEAVLRHSGPVASSMIRGQWALPFNADCQSACQ